LLPTGCKVCNFNCIYCECGWNDKAEMKYHSLPTRTEVFEALETKLREMFQKKEIPDVITFAGNGEPTIHPFFNEIIDDTILLRNKFFPDAQISVLSNSTMLHNSRVVDALCKVDQNILKLDSAIQSTLESLNQPTGKLDIDNLISNLKNFNGKLIVQTLFTRGEYQGEQVNNTSEEELSAWETAIKEIAPQKVMIYTIERNTPLSGLQKIPLSELNIIAQRISLLGIEVQVSG
ncbi:MAG: radical SAM protein, partial [Bacteroidetes bacterium]|nr:radical SAM protein [Bacteroidota bacterium]